MRQREGLPPDEMGDELMASRDLLPLRIAVQHPEMLLNYNTGGNAQEGGTNA